MARRKRDETGASALEFALVLPILVLFLFGTINFGVYFAHQLAMSNAARQAARAAAVEGGDCIAQIEKAKQEAATLDLTASEINVDVSPGECPKPCEDTAPGDSVTVTMTADKDFIIPMPIPGFPSGVDLEAEGTFRCEYS